MDKVRVIIVDDEPRIRRKMIRIVESCGEDFVVVGDFSDGKEAFEKIENKDLCFDILLTDVQMPGMDGLELINSLKANRFFESIIISGYDEFTYLQTALKEGVSNYLLKPINKEDMKVELLQLKAKVKKNRANALERECLENRARELHYTKQIHFLSEISIYEQVGQGSQYYWNRYFGEKYLSIT